jgi:uncharacterized small protein (DUF1192 family)
LDPLDRASNVLSATREIVLGRFAPSPTRPSGWKIRTLPASPSGSKNAPFRPCHEIRTAPLAHPSANKDSAGEDKPDLFCLQPDPSMTSLDDRIAALETRIEKYEADLDKPGITENRKDKLLDAITASRNDLTQMRKESTAGNNFVISLFCSALIWVCLRTPTLYLLVNTLTQHSLQQDVCSLSQTLVKRKR